MMTKEISCYEAVALVSDYLEGALSWRSRRRLEHHLDGCDACGAYLEQMREIIAICGVVTPDDLSDAALSRLVEVFERYQDEVQNPPS